MNLQPLYDVKERLSQAAVAGTALLGEDFRLKRAAENLAPLAQANPVFAKIRAGIEKLLAAPAGESGGLLLDVLALVDAVLYTQGVTQVEGEMEPLPAVDAICLPISYGQLHPLMEALTGTGGGRMGVIEDAWKYHPEFFLDYRILPALVGALGDKYGEIAELAEHILIKTGSAVVPYVKEGFDPAGKYEMIRRIHVLEALEPEKVSEFCFQWLQESKKDVRAALVYALRHGKENGERLLELCKTKKGAVKDMAYRALARMDDPDTWEYFEKMADREAKKKDMTGLIRLADMLNGSTSQKAGEFARRLFMEWFPVFSGHPGRNSQEERLAVAILMILPGKPGNTVAECYRQAAACKDTLDWMNLKWNIQGGWNDDNAFYTLKRTVSNRMVFSLAIPQLLRRSLLLHPDPVLADLSLELYHTYGDRYLSPALTAMLLTAGSSECYEWAEKQFYQAAGSVRTDAIKEFKEAFTGLVWENTKGRHQYCYSDQESSGREKESRLLYENLDPRWYGLFMDGGDTMAERLLILLGEYPDLSVLPERAGKYFYEKSLQADYRYTYRNPVGYLNLLLRLGWNDWDGFLCKYEEKSANFSSYSVISLLDLLPLSNAKKLKELKAAIQFAENNRLKTDGHRKDMHMEILRAKAEELKNSPDLPADV